MQAGAIEFGRADAARSLQFATFAHAVAPTHHVRENLPERGESAGVRR